MKNNSFPLGRARVGYQQILSYADYYTRFGTTEEVDGWRRVFLPEQQKTIYVKWTLVKSEGVKEWKKIN